MLPTLRLAQIYLLKFVCVFEFMFTKISTFIQKPLEYSKIFVTFTWKVGKDLENWPGGSVTLLGNSGHRLL